MMDSHAESARTREEWGRMIASESDRARGVRIRTGNFNLRGRGFVAQMREPKNLVVVLFLRIHVVSIDLETRYEATRPRCIANEDYTGNEEEIKCKAKSSTNKCEEKKRRQQQTFHSLGSSNDNSGDSSSSPTPRSSSPFSPSPRSASMRSWSCSISLSYASKERFCSARRTCAR